MPTLNLENIGQIDHDQAKALVDEAISLAVSDLDKHGTDGGVRKVKIQIEMWYDEDAEQNRAVVKAQAVLPAKSTGEVKGRTKVDGSRARFLFENLRDIEDVDHEEEEKDAEAPE